MARAVDETLVGSTLGNYNLTRKLGHGAMAVVFEGRRPSGERAAVKVIRPEAMKTLEQLSRFEREAKTLQVVDHPNVVRLLEVGQSEGLVYLVLELVEGETLEARLKKRKQLNAADATRLAIDLFRGLASIHEKGIVHRDLKPANICGTTAGSWKISDFGLARRDEKEESIVLTAPGTLLGTPHYMSPEQAKGVVEGGRSDLYSAGATLYHAIAGEPVFPRENLVAILAAHTSDPPIELTTRVPSVPRELAKLIHRCLEKDPGDRPKSARECLQALGIKDLPPVEKRPTPVAASEIGREPLAPTPAPAGAPGAPASAAPVVRRGTVRITPQEPTPTTPTGKTGHGRLTAPPVDEPERRTPTKPAHVRPRWLKAFIPWTLGIAIGTGKALLELKPQGFDLEHWLALQRPKLPPAIAAHVTAPQITTFLNSWGLVVAPALVIVGCWRVGARYVKDNAPKDARARTLLARAYLRIRIARDEKTDPPSAAEALRDLGEPDEAAHLLVASGHGALAADFYKRSNDPIAAGQIYERMKEITQAIECYVSAGLIERAAKLASDNGQHDEAGNLYARAHQTDRAVEAFRKALKPQAAVTTLEEAGRPLDAAQEIQNALKDGRSFKRLGPEERRLLVKRSAELFDRGGRPRTAAPLYEEAGERERAFLAYEKSGVHEEAARLAKLLGRHERAAELWEKGHKPLEAARSRAEALVARGQVVEAAKVLEDSGDKAAAGELYEQGDASLEAARCFEAIRDNDRAAYLYARARDFARAAGLYERLKSWHEAGRAWHEHGDHAASARAYERAPDPIAAADEYAHANALDESARVLAAVPATSPQAREARARLGDLHAAAGREAEAAQAYSEAIPEAATIDRDSARRLIRLADAHGRLGRPDLARVTLGRLRGGNHAPDDLEARIAAFADGAPAARSTSRLKPQPPGARSGVASPVPGPNVARSAVPTPAPQGSSAALLAKGPASLVGTEIDRYKLLELIGEGATAWVYKAEHSFLRRAVAFKLLKPMVVGGEGLAQRFLSEGQAVAALRHPNLIEVFDCGVTPEGLLWMALELVPGTSLRETIKARAPLPVAQAARIGAGVLAGLSAAHAAGIVHRDLKPENILLAPGDRAKVVDFGIAKVLASGKNDTSKQAFLGTPRYFSPEQAMGREVTPAADQYALGLVLYEMLAGEGPFVSATPVGYLTQHASAAPPTLRAKAPQVPEKLAEAIMRALEKEPGARFSSTENMRRAVVAFAPRAPGPSQSGSGD